MSPFCFTDKIKTTTTGRRGRERGGKGGHKACINLARVKMKNEGFPHTQE